MKREAVATAVCLLMCPLTHLANHLLHSSVQQLALPMPLFSQHNNKVGDVFSCRHFRDVTLVQFVDLGLFHQSDFTVVFFLCRDVQVANSALRKRRSKERAKHQCGILSFYHTVCSYFIILYVPIFGKDGK